MTATVVEFRPSRAERRLRGQGWQAQLGDLAGAEVTGRSLNLFAGGPRRRLRIRLKDGGEEVFVVNHVYEAAATVNSAIQAAQS